MTTHFLPSIGLGGSLHDYTACFLDDAGRLHIAEAERYIRRRYALNHPGEHTSAIDELRRRCGGMGIEGARVCGDDMISDRYFPQRIRLNHHTAHAFGSFFTSNFEDAAILIVDGVGSSRSASDPEVRETTTFAVGHGNRIDDLDKIYGHPSEFRAAPESPRIRHNSLGDLYRLATEVLGFGPLQAGKTMGMAPYGDDRYVKAMTRYITLEKHGRFSINMSETDGMVAWATRLKGMGSFQAFENRASMALAAQRCLEMVVWHCLDHLYKITRCTNLCIVGGVALNSCMNGRIAVKSAFTQVHVMPAPGDNGAAIGAALFAGMKRTRGSTSRLTMSAYLGEEYPPLDIENAIRSTDLNLDDPLSPEQVAARLAEGQTVAVFRGRAEVGPRALGNRSILADPRDPATRDTINSLKGRESFRPLAPSVLEDSAQQLFAVTTPGLYMEAIANASELAKRTMPACVHVDGTARVQVVRKSENEWFAEVLAAFSRLTGVAGVLNTSFNVAGEPIVERPQDAVRTFEQTEGIDALVFDCGTLSRRVRND